MKIPPIPRELVAHLAVVYPDRCPDPSWTDREIWMAAGRRDVVNTLKQWLKEQDELGVATEGRLPNVLQSASPHDRGEAAGHPGSTGSTAARAPGSPGNRLGSDA